MLPYAISLLYLIIDFLSQFSRNDFYLFSCIFLTLDVVNEGFFVEGELLLLVFLLLDGLFVDADFASGLVQVIRQLHVPHGGGHVRRGNRLRPCAFAARIHEIVEPQFLVIAVQKLLDVPLLENPFVGRFDSLRVDAPGLLRALVHRH